MFLLLQTCLMSRSLVKKNTWFCCHILYCRWTDILPKMSNVRLKDVEMQLCLIRNIQWFHTRKMLLYTAGNVPTSSRRCPIFCHNKHAIARQTYPVVSDNEEIVFWHKIPVFVATDTAGNVPTTCQILLAQVCLRMLKHSLELRLLACQTCCLSNHHHHLQLQRKENLRHVEIFTCAENLNILSCRLGRKTVVFLKACECFSWVDLNSLQHFWHLTTTETNPIFTRELSPRPWIIFRSRRVFWRGWCYRRRQKRWPKL